MTAKEYVDSIDNRYKSLLKKNEELTIYNINASGISSTPMDNERVQTNVNPNKIVNAAVKMVTLENEIKDLRMILKNSYSVFITYLDKMENEDYAQLLFQRYVNHKSLYKIAKENCIDYGNLKKSHKKALKMLDNLL